MGTDRTRALAELLARTEAAHGEYEATELNGEYDREWPRWYARYAVDLGIGTLVGRSITADELERFLVTSWAELQRADPPPADPWATHTARRLAAELEGRPLR